MPRVEAEAIAIRHYEGQIARTGKGSRTLQVIHAAGLLSVLPKGIEPLVR